jgi:hypothetical protein
MRETSKDLDGLDDQSFQVSRSVAGTLTIVVRSPVSERLAAHQPLSRQRQEHHSQSKHQPIRHSLIFHVLYLIEKYICCQEQYLYFCFFMIKAMAQREISDRSPGVSEYR